MDSPIALRHGELSSSTCSSPQSPHAMAEEAVATAMLGKKERETINEKKRNFSTEATLRNKKRQSRRGTSDKIEGATISSPSSDCISQECSSSTASSSPNTSCSIAGTQEEKGDHRSAKPSIATTLMNSLQGKSHGFSNSSSKSKGTEEEEEIGKIWDEFTQECLGQSDGSSIREEAKDALLEAINDIILGKVIDNMIDRGVEGFQELDIVTRDAMTLNRMLDARQRELKRLQNLEAASHTSLTVSIKISVSRMLCELFFLDTILLPLLLSSQKLLDEVRESNSNIQNTSTAAQVEAHLGNELQIVRSERDKSVEACMELTKKNSLLEEELALIKGKLNRLIQDKMKVERDSRAAISLARSLDMRTSSDAEFYKRKVTEYLL